MPRQKKAMRPVPDRKALVGSDPDFVRSIVTEVLNQVMEAEMKDLLGAAKGERTPRARATGRAPTSAC
jgi:transposase-like protein